MWHRASSLTSPSLFPVCEVKIVPHGFAGRVSKTMSLTPPALTDAQSMPLATLISSCASHLLAPKQMLPGEQRPHLVLPGALHKPCVRAAQPRGRARDLKSLRYTLLLVQPRLALPHRSRVGVYLVLSHFQGRISFQLLAGSISPQARGKGI